MDEVDCIAQELQEWRHLSRSFFRGKRKGSRVWLPLMQTFFQRRGTRRKRSPLTIAA